jgi:hypothetical protein
MPVVVLIPTGKLEHAALATALARVFPGVIFNTRPHDEHLAGFTSNDVTKIILGRQPQSSVEELAANLVASIVPGRRGEAADYAVVVEDLELKNDHQPDHVIEVFREAVRRHVLRNWSSQNKQDGVFGAIRNRCSFHLFRPMTEAYFFGEPLALSRAGAVDAAKLDLAPDLECFQTNDAAFLGLPADPRLKKHRRIVNMPERQRHPKSYLHYLCDPTLTDPNKKYREIEGGVAALQKLDWGQVVAAAPHCPFLHSFLDDLSFALNHPLPFITKDHAEPRTMIGRPDLLLRNI